MILLNHKANPNLVDSNGSAVMNLAATETDISWLREALGHGGDPNVLNEGNRSSPGDTPLFYAISRNRPECAKLLLRNGANINHRNNRGSFPLFEAVATPAYEVAAALIEAGADFRAKDRHGDDVLQYLSRRNERYIHGDDQKEWFRRTVQLLKDKGVDVKLLP